MDILDAWDTGYIRLHMQAGANCNVGAIIGTLYVRVVLVQVLDPVPQVGLRRLSQRLYVENSTSKLDERC